MIDLYWRYNKVHGIASRVDKFNYDESFAIQFLGIARPELASLEDLASARKSTM
jgi:hypothetical protein